MTVDLFAAPLGSTPQDPDLLEGISPVPAEAFDYRGQWVAIRGDKVVAARNRLRDLYNAPELQDTDVTYHVPARPTVAF
jgi:Family of unknown function (DUF5678)